MFAFTNAAYRGTCGTINKPPVPRRPDDDESERIGDMHMSGAAASGNAPRRLRYTRGPIFEILLRSSKSDERSVGDEWVHAAGAPRMFFLAMLQCVCG